MPKYNYNILNYYNDNSHVGKLETDSNDVGTGLVGSPSCGDVMKLQIKIESNSKDSNSSKINNDINNKKIIDAKVLVFGCGSAKASSSYVAEQLVGKTIGEALKIKNTDIANYLGLPKIKLHCSVLAESAIKRAINDYINKNSDVEKINKEGNNYDNVKMENKNSQTDKSLNNNDKKFFVDITNEAVNFIRNTIKQVEKEKKIKIKGIKLSLEEGHCGLMYKVRYIDDKEDLSNFIFTNLTSNKENNESFMKIFIKQNELEVLNGTKIEYKEENLKRGLIFKNPREIGRCNCGMNFFTDKKKD